MSNHIFDPASKERGGEDEEVSEVKLISEDEILNYDWAWNHGFLLQEVVRISRNEKK